MNEKLQKQSDRASRQARPHIYISHVQSHDHAARLARFALDVMAGVRQLAHTWLRCLVLSRHTRKSLELITPFESCANNLSSYKCFRYTSTFLARADFRLSSHLRFHLVILMHHPCPSHHIAAAAETPLDDEAEGACVYA